MHIIGISSFESDCRLKIQHHQKIFCEKNKNDNFLTNPNPYTPSNFSHPQSSDNSLDAALSRIFNKFLANKPSYNICLLSILRGYSIHDYIDNRTNSLKFSPESFKTMKKMIYNEGFKSFKTIRKMIYNEGFRFHSF